MSTLLKIYLLPKSLQNFSFTISLLQMVKPHSLPTYSVGQFYNHFVELRLKSSL